MSMTCRQKVTKQGKMFGHLSRLIEKSAFVIFTRYENIASIHKATAPVSTVLAALCQKKLGNFIESI